MLLALLGLLVPLAIYLWNRRPGPEVAVGSLRWLAAGANRRLRNLKPEQLGLLLLRAALLAALAVAVAGPAWRQARPAGRGQVLVGPELAGAPELAAVRPLLDSLRRQGYALRWLARGFPAVSADSLGRYRGRAGENFRWARVRQAADSFPGQPLHVVAAGTLRGWAGPHPPLPAAVAWHLLPTAATDTWLAAATAGRADSLRLLLGQSSATQTTFRAVSAARPAAGAVLRVPGLAPLRYGAAGSGQLRFDLARGRAAAVPVGPPLRAVVYATPAHADEARYLRAALQAAGLGLPMPLGLRAAATPPGSATATDWLFWLSDAPLPALLLGVLRPDSATDDTAPFDAHDQRGFDVAQLTAGPAPQGAAAQSLPATAFAFTDLRPWLVLFAALLFALERWLARRAAALSLTA